MVFWLTVAVLCLALFAADLVTVKDGILAASDRSLELDAHHALGTSTYAVFRDISLVGGGTVRTGLIVLIALVLAVLRRWWLVILVVVGTGGASLLDYIVKGLVARPRPELFVHGTAAGGYSFPSGHAMDSFAFLFVVAYLFWYFMRHVGFALLVSVLAGICIALIGLSRVVLGVHYPSDVVGGYALSAAWLSLVLAVLDRPLRREKVLAGNPERTSA